MNVITVTDAKVVAFFKSISVAPIASPNPWKQWIEQRLLLKLPMQVS